MSTNSVLILIVLSAKRLSTNQIRALASGANNNNKDRSGLIDQV